MVMFQQSSEASTTPDGSIAGLVGFGFGQEWDDVPESLVRSFDVIVLDVLRDRMLKHRLAKEDHSLGAFLLDRSDKAFREGVQIRTSRGQLQRLGADGLEDHVEAGCELLVAIADQIPALPDHLFAVAGEVANDLSHRRA